jgi:tyrosinase
MANEIRTRVGAHNLSQPQIDGLREAFTTIAGFKDNRSFGYIAGLHGTPGWYCWHHQQNRHSARVRQLFLPWHRAYLYTLERSLRDISPQTMLPWWDWTLRPPRQDGMPKVFTDPAPNPLLRFHMRLTTSQGVINRDTVRHPKPGNQLPTQADIDDCIGKPDWLDFCLALEDVHDGVHGWVGGDMGQVSLAAYDPVFWAHHTMIDRIWWLWQIKHGNGDIPANLLDIVLAPFNFKVRDVLNVQSLGYDYAAARRRITIAGP